jgi:hypothetical protein
LFIADGNKKAFSQPQMISLRKNHKGEAEKIRPFSQVFAYK